MIEKELITQQSDFELEIEQIMSGNKGLSYSALRSFLESPKHFYEYKTNPDDTVTKAMIEGRIFHEACLEYEKFINKYWVLDDTEKCNELINEGYIDDKGKLIYAKSPRSTKPYKDWVIEQESLNEGKEKISKDDFDTFTQMSKALRFNSATKHFFDCGGENEYKIEFEHDGFKIKGSIDRKGKDFILDLKKVSDARYKKIKWDIEEKKYHMQAGIYSYPTKIKNYYLVYIDKGCNITVVKLNEETLSRGFMCFENALSEFSRCAEENLWHSSYEFFNGGFINY